MTGKRRKDIVPIHRIDHVDNVRIAVVNGCWDYDYFLSLPEVLEIEGSIYCRTGWNSDSGLAYFRDDVMIGREV